MHRAKTNNQGLLTRRQNGPDATSRWIDFQKTSLNQDEELKVLIVFLISKDIPKIVILSKDLKNKNTNKFINVKNKLEKRLSQDTTVNVETKRG